MTTEPIDACAAAIAGVRTRYEVIVIDGDNVCQIRGWNAVEGASAISKHGTREQCHAWIDCEMARACLGADGSQARIETTDRCVRNWRRAYFRDNPPNTYLANVSNDILRVLGTYQVDQKAHQACENAATHAITKQEEG